MDFWVLPNQTTYITLTYSAPNIASPPEPSLEQYRFRRQNITLPSQNIRMDDKHTIEMLVKQLEEQKRINAAHVETNKKLKQALHDKEEKLDDKEEELHEAYERIDHLEQQVVQAEADAAECKCYSFHMPNEESNFSLPI
jgi:seryl-tRNA synthetase